MKSIPIGAEFRITSPNGASRDMVASDAPTLADLYNHPASNNGQDLIFYTPSMPNYAEITEYWNHFPNQPKLLAMLRPRTEAAVQAAVGYLVEHGIPLGVRGRGHAPCGQGRADDGGVVIDMRAMDSVSLAADDSNADDDGSPYRAAIVGGGITVGNIGRSLHTQGLVTPTAWASTVGYTGWALGGGSGFLSAKYGMGVDNILGARLVTWDGKVVDTDIDDGGSELLWALRGAGNGNLGVITELRVKAHPVSGFLAGVIGFSLADTKEVNQKLCEVIKSTPGDLPDALVGDQMVLYALDTEPIFIFHFAWTIDGDEGRRQGEKWLQTVRSLGDVKLDTVEDVPLHEFHDWIAAAEPSGNYYMPTRNTRGALLADPIADIVARSPPPNPSSSVVIHYTRGKAAMPNPDCIFAAREDHTTVIMGAGTPAGTDANDPEMHRAMSWADQVLRDIDSTGLVIDNTYAHFEDPERIDIVQKYGPENAKRLQKVKEQYDPHNVFYRGYPRFPDMGAEAGDGPNKV